MTFVCGWTDKNISLCLILGKYCPIVLGAMVKIHLSYPGSKPLLAAADRAAAEAAGWNVIKAPPPPGVPGGGQANVSAVACETARKCLAVGSYRRETKEFTSAQTQKCQCQM
jgi:hypothetical protein